MGKAKTGARVFVGQKCSKCGVMSIRHTIRNTKTTEKLERKKYCPRCKSVQIFKEAKIGK